MSFFDTYKQKFHSQWGEEGVVLEILKRLEINPQNKWMCEFGAWDGKHLSNTFHFVENMGSKAVYIEGDEERYQDLLKTCEIHKNIVPIKKFVNHDLDNILETTDIPQDFLMLSIDVDGIDYHIWKHTEKYKPIIVIIEIDSGIPPPVEYVYNTENTTGYKINGTTFQSMLNLANEKGYNFVTHTGNMIFVRNDYFDKLNLNFKHPLDNFCTRHVKSPQNKSLLQNAKRLYSN